MVGREGTRFTWNAVGGEVPRKCLIHHTSYCTYLEAGILVDWSGGVSDLIPENTRKPVRISILLCSIPFCAKCALMAIINGAADPNWSWTDRNWSQRKRRSASVHKSRFVGVESSEAHHHWKRHPWNPDGPDAFPSTCINDMAAGQFGDVCY